MPQRQAPDTTARADVAAGGAVAAGTAPLEPAVATERPAVHPFLLLGPGGFRKLRRRFSLFVAGPVTESLTIGGAIAKGHAPGEVIPDETQETRRRAFMAPPAMFFGPAGLRKLRREIQVVTAPPTTTIGGAVAAGVGPVARAAVGQGGATAGGVAPGEATSSGETVPQGGATAGGVGPVARAALTIGGAVGAGVAPGESTGATETPTPGGAIATGTAPTSRAVTGNGGATAGGSAPTAAQSTTIGGAVAAGTTSNAARVLVTTGGATAAGQLTDPAGVRPPGSLSLSDALAAHATIVHSPNGDTALQDDSGSETVIVHSVP